MIEKVSQVKFSKIISNVWKKPFCKLDKDLLGYLPKGIIRDFNDLEPLGEHYKEEYRPKTPDAFGDC